MANTTKTVILMLALTVSASFLCGCASSMARMTVDSMKPIMEDMRTATNSNPDVEMVRKAMPQFLVQMDGFIQTSPQNRYLLASAAEATIGYAFLFVEDVDKERAKGLYYKARGYALRNLMLNETFKKALEQDDVQVFSKALKTIHKRDIAALYFAANAWLSWINLAYVDNPYVLKDIPKVEAMMDRILVLDDTFYHGGIHTLLGVYHASRPEGKAEQVNDQFRKAFEISQSRYLLWDFLYARYYAVQIKDKELFVSTLNKIVSAPDNLLPEESFVNGAVKQKAGKLLAHVDDYFK